MEKLNSTKLKTSERNLQKLTCACQHVVVDWPYGERCHKPQFPLSFERESMLNVSELCQAFSTILCPVNNGEFVGLVTDSSRWSPLTWYNAHPCSGTSPKAIGGEQTVLQAERPKSLKHVLSLEEPQTLKQENFRDSRAFTPIDGMLLLLSIQGGITGFGCCTRQSESQQFRKIPVSVKCFACNSGAGNGCANFMAPGRMRSLCRKTHAHKIPRFGGGGAFGFFFWGGG